MLKIYYAAMKFLAKELEILRKLSPQAKRLLASFAIREFASPIFGIFMSAFLFKTSGTLTIPVIYNLAIFLLVPFGMVFNGLALRRYSSAKLYLTCSIVHSLTLLPIFFGGASSILWIVAAGALRGIGMGFYWGNRNFMSLGITKDEERNFFLALEHLAERSVSIVAPAIIGWLIVLGESFGLYEFSYQILAIVALILLTLGGVVVMKLDYPTPDTSILFLKKSDARWNRMRISSLIKGVYEATIWFVPALMILYLVGNEGILGSWASAVTLINIAVMYAVGRVARLEDRIHMITSGIALILLGAAAIAYNFSIAGAAIYSIASTLGFSIFYGGLGTMFMAAADDQRNGDLRYAKIIDHEIFLCGGRAIGALAFILAVSLIGDLASLRYVPLAAALCLTLIIPVVRQL